MCKILMKALMLGCNLPKTNVLFLLLPNFELLFPFHAQSLTWLNMGILYVHDTAFYHIITAELTVVIQIAEIWKYV